MRYVLPGQWSAFGIAGIDFDPENYENALKQVKELCEGIGKELAIDLSSLAQHLPSMLRSNSENVFTVARTIGRETLEPRKAWETILAEILSPAHEERLSDFPSAFLGGLSKTNPDLCEQLLDESFANSSLHPVFAQMQASAGLDETGSMRLIEALKHETVPVHMYRMLACGRACDGLSASNLNALLLAIAAREGGVEVALDILYMRLLAKRSDSRPIEDAEKEAGRELLRAAIFERSNQRREADVLAELVRQCLDSPSDEGIAKVLCERLLEGITQRQVDVWYYGDFMAALADKFPRSVLDILVERADVALQERYITLVDFSDDGPCPFDGIPDDVLVEWAGERPEVRFLQLAKVIRLWRHSGREQAIDSGDEVGPLQWTPPALKICVKRQSRLKYLGSMFIGFTRRHGAVRSRAFLSCGCHF